MKIFVKTLSQEQFDFDVQPSETILDLKNKIEKQLGHNVAWQKLIFAGKILLDNQTFETSGIQEGNFLVIMVRKVPVKETPAPSTQQTTTPTIETKATPTTTTTTTTSTTTTAPTPTPTAPTPSTPQTAPTSSVPKPVESAQQNEEEAIIQRIMEFGFERKKIVAALKASFGHPDRAVEYLMNDSIPEDIGTVHPQAPQQLTQPSISFPIMGQQQQSQQPQQSQPQQTQQQQQQQGGGLADFLRSIPQGEQILQLAQSNPQLITPLLQQLAQSNPQVLEFITQHQEEFLQLMNEGSSDSSENGNHQVAEEDREAIERLEALGFDRAMVIEAYFICDKDENSTANYLLEHGDME